MINFNNKLIVHLWNKKSAVVFVLPALFVFILFPLYLLFLVFSFIEWAIDLSFYSIDVYYNFTLFSFLNSQYINFKNNSDELFSNFNFSDTESKPEIQKNLVRIDDKGKKWYRVYG